MSNPDVAENYRASERMRDTVLVSAGIAAPTFALILGLGLGFGHLDHAQRPLIVVGGLLWAFNAVASLYTSRQLAETMGLDPHLSRTEAARPFVNGLLFLAFTALAHPLPGWLLMLPILAMNSAALVGRMRSLAVFGLVAACCAVLAILGASSQEVLLCAGTSLSAGLVFAGCSQRLQDGRKELGDIIREVVQRERDHAEAVLSAQRSNRLASVGQLAAGVAHEINNPLTYVISNIEFLLEQEALLRQHLSEEQALSIVESSQDALEGANRVLRIVRSIKLFARLDREVQMQDVDVGAALHSSLDIARNQIRHRALLETRFADELPPVHADEGRLGQVFINLLINAAQALPDGDEGDAHTITVTTEYGEAGFVIVSISDTGMGIEPANMAKIFDPFYTSKPVGEGTGLGLSIVHGIVADYGGHIRVTSEVGKGTTFAVHLPASVVSHPVPKSSRAPLARSPTNAGRVMIIDDEALVAKSLARMLTKTESTSVDGAEAALALLRKDANYDLLFCDLMMPGMSGPKFFEILQAEFPALARKVIFITGGVFSDVIQDFLDCGKAPCLYKPFSRDDVHEAITCIEEACARDGEERS